MLVMGLCEFVLLCYVGSKIVLMLGKGGKFMVICLVDVYCIYRLIIVNVKNGIK